MFERIRILLIPSFLVTVNRCLSSRAWWRKWTRLIQSIRKWRWCVKEYALLWTLSSAQNQRTSRRSFSAGQGELQKCSNLNDSIFIHLLSSIQSYWLNMKIIFTRMYYHKTITMPSFFTYSNLAVAFLSSVIGLCERLSIFSESSLSLFLTMQSKIVSLIIFPAIFMLLTPCKNSIIR